DEVPADALYLRAGQGVLGERVSHAAHPILRVPGRSDVVADRGRVPVRPGPVGGAPVRGGGPPQGVPPARHLDRLSDRPELRRSPNGYALMRDPLGGKVKWRITRGQ